jgi:hypothetical protein
MAIKMAREAGPFFSVVDLCLVNKEMKHYFLGVGKKYLERTINVLYIGIVARANV